MNTGSHIGQYKILRTLGSGGMGTVFLGEHVLLGRRAAIKTLLPALSVHREIVDRFFNEARAITAISDPGIVQVFDFGYHVDGTAYLVMEYLEGESLMARIDRLGRLPILSALRIARQIAQSLGATHAAGIIHRDLKPSNVFLIRDPEAQGGERTKILDFGICALTDNDASITQTGPMLGTPVYMSPEQCRGNGPIDHRSDVYSVGCALYHMMTGRPPFVCDSLGEFIASHLKDEPAPPSEHAPDLPPEVDVLLLQCLAKDPEDRFQSMGELQDVIEAVLASLSDRMPAPVVALEKPVDPWFVESLAPVPAAPITDEWATPAPRTRWPQRIALAAALGCGLVAGLLGTQRLIEQRAVRDAAAPAKPTTPAALEEAQSPSPRATSKHEQAPPEQPANEEPAVADKPAAPPPDKAAAPTFTHDAPAVEKPVRPPRPYVKPRPKPRRVVPLEEPNEDLYDTR